MTESEVKIIWYKDDELRIEFDKMPNVAMTYPMPVTSLRESRATAAIQKNKKNIKKPFLNKEDLKVTIKYLSNKYTFTIPKGYTWDGATIPRFFWRFIGANTSPEFLIPSMIHDVLCENHSYIDNDRYLSTIILERLLCCSGVGSFKRWMMKHSVDNFQKIKGGWK
ncbi:MAG: DUF1353 domain-containing protein [Candidatus Gastranaerophilales bacterium]|nr:DUF1353 domain-containing protein [Candidatus Gastranaerophilales bacterium]